MSAGDLLALLNGGSASKQQPAQQSSLDDLFARFTSPPAKHQAVSPAQGGQSQADALLGIFSSPQPKAASPAVAPALASGNDLLAQLFGSAKPSSSPQVTTPPAPVVSPPAATQQAAQVSAPLPASQPTMFDFYSPFDVLAKASPKPKPSPAPQAGPSSQSIPSVPQQPTFDPFAVLSQPSKAATSVETPRPAVSSPPPVQAAERAVEPPARATPQKPVEEPAAVKSPPSVAPSTPQRSAAADAASSASTPAVPAGATSSKAQSSRARFVGAGNERSLVLDPSARSQDHLSPIADSPIVRFPVQVAFSQGSILALPGQTIAYATKLGRIRVLDRATGARMLLRLHGDALIDLSAAQKTHDGWIRVASCAKDGKLIVWRIPSQFEKSADQYEVLAEISAASPTRFAKLRWSPDGNKLAVLTQEGRVVIMDLQGFAWKKSLANGKSIKEREALEGQQTLPPAGYVDLGWSADSAQLVLASNAHEGTSARLQIVDAKDISRVLASARLESPRGSISQVAHLGPGVTAVSFRRGQEIEITSSVLGERAFISLGGSSSHFSKFAWDASSSTLYICDSRGVIYSLRLDVEQLKFVSISETVLDEPVVALEKSEGDSSLFCVLASGISQLHLLAEEAVEEPEEPAEEAVAKSNEVPQRDVSDAIQVVQETIIVAEQQEGLTEPEISTPAIPAREPSPEPEPASTLPEAPAVTNGVHVNGHSPAAADSTELLAAIRLLIGELGEKWTGDRTAYEAAELERQEQVLKTVSTTLTNNTSKTVDATVRQEIQSSVVPAVHQALKASVNAEIMAEVNESVRKSLPDALEKLFQRTDIGQAMARQIAAAAKPVITETVTSIVSKQLLTGLNNAVTTAVNRMVSDVRGEMVDIRKSIVAEQSAALTTLTADVAALRAKLEEQSAQVPAPVAHHQPVTHQPVAQQQQQAARPSTPPQALADQVLGALESQDPNALDQLVFTWPPHRFVVLFTRPSPLSMVHLLGVAHKLSAQITASSPLTPEARLRLRWVTASCDAIDKRSNAEVAVHVPRILDRVRNSLLPIRDLLSHTGDANGAQTVNEALSSIQQAIERP